MLEVKVYYKNGNVKTKMIDMTDYIDYLEKDIKVNRDHITKLEVVSV